MHKFKIYIKMGIFKSGISLISLCCALSFLLMPSNAFPDEEKQMTKKEIKAVLRGGKLLFNKKQYAESREKFQEVLSYDEKNKTAIRYIKNIDKKMPVKEEKTLGQTMNEARELYGKGKYYKSWETFLKIVVKHKQDVNAVQYARRRMEEIEGILGVELQEKVNRVLSEKSSGDEDASPYIEAQKETHDLEYRREADVDKEAEKFKVVNYKEDTEAASFVLKRLQEEGARKIERPLGIKSYIGPLFYDDSIDKDYGFKTGTYISVEPERYPLALEVEFDYTRTYLIKDGQEDQFDLTIVYKQKDVPNLEFFKIGTHFTYIDFHDPEDVSDRNTDGAVVLFAGAEHRLFKWCDLGLDGYFEWHYDYAAEHQRLSYQLTPIMKFHIFDVDWARLDGALKGYYIQFLDKDWNNGRNNLNSAEVSIALTVSKLELEGFSYIGKQKYAIRRDGFDVYTDPYTYIGGAGISLNYSYTDYLRMGISCIGDLFEYEGVDGRSMLFLISGQYLF